MKKLPKASDPLLTRDEFREAVFARDNHKCVICGEEAQDSHHILERRLFEDGGYYLSNGASLCAKHHIEAEQTILSVEQIREAAGIFAPALPEHFYPDEQYSKWGDIILGNGMRAKGELFNDSSVQKILKEGNVLNLYTEYCKYQRTMHLPFSPGLTNDDRVHKNLDGFIGEEIIAMVKWDGENSSLYPDYFHARSLDSKPHPSQSWARNFHAKIKHNIPAGWRINAENLYAKHSIKYDDLDSYLPVFAIWDENNICLDWDSTELWGSLIGMDVMPVFYRGIFDEKFIRDIKLKPNQEGYVIRVARSFKFAEFKKVVGKYVRKGHVQTTHHWKSQMIEPNKLKTSKF